MLFGAEQSNVVTRFVFATIGLALTGVGMAGFLNAIKLLQLEKKRDEARFKKLMTEIRRLRKALTEKHGNDKK